MQARNDGSMLFQRALDQSAYDSVVRPNLVMKKADSGNELGNREVDEAIANVLRTPGAASSVRLSDTNLNADDCDQLQELQHIQNVLQSSVPRISNNDSERDVDNANGIENPGNYNTGLTELEGQNTPRMHPLEYLRNEAERELMAKEGQP